MAKKIKNPKLNSTNMAKPKKVFTAFQQHANQILERKKKNIEKKKDIVNRLSKQNKQNKLADLRINKTKKIKFNLNQDDLQANILFTHKGKKIQEIEEFEDMVSVSDSQLQEQVIQNTHFGGFQNSNTKQQNKQAVPKTKKEIYDQIIAKSKMHKYIKQKQHQDNFQKAVQLDTEFPDLVKNLHFRTNDRKYYQIQNQQNDFQTLMNNLKDDIRIDCQKDIPKETKKQQTKRKNKKLEYLKALQQESEDVDVRGWAKNINEQNEQNQEQYDEIDDVQLSSGDEQQQQQGQQQRDDQQQGYQNDQQEENEQQQSQVYSNKDQF